MNAKNFIIILATILLTACKGYKHGDLQLDGDCRIVSITLNEKYGGKVILADRKIDVKLPEIYNTDSMVITDIQLSAGATADVYVGMQLCMREPRRVRVVNGNTFIDWTIVPRHADATIARFRVSGVPGIISKSDSIIVYVPGGQDVQSLIPTAELSQDAIIEPAVGKPTDFSKPVKYTVTDDASRKEYVVSVVPIYNPEVLFVSSVDGMDELGEEELAACQSMLSQVPSLYTSFKALRDGKIDISQCKVIWWHGHRDNAVGNSDAFQDWGKEAIASKKFLQDYLKNGGSLFFSRFATYMPGFMSIGDVPASKWYPNNCFGDPEAKSWPIGEEWGFRAYEKTHPIYKDIVNADGNIQMLAKGYLVSNSTAQWVIGGWSALSSLEEFTAKTGATPIGVNGDGYPVAWEWKRTAEHGGILCIGSGVFDFYSPAEVYDSPHENVDKLVLNVINYLKQ